MKAKRFLTSGTIAAVFLMLLTGLAFSQAPDATPLGTGFTYQGQLLSDDTPYSGTCDFLFGLYDAATMGTAVGELTLTELTVAEGIFTAQLDFGSDKFTGDNRWLDIWVRCPAGDGEYQQLSPRQALTAAPYSLYARAVPWSGITGIPTGFADGVDNDTTYAPGWGLTLTGGMFTVNTAAIQERVDGVCGAGYAISTINQDGTVTCEPVGGSGWSLTGNTGTIPGTNFLGTTDNQALDIRVNNLRAFRFEPNDSGPNLIGGYLDNWITSSVYGVTISGGGGPSLINRVTDNYGTIGGGANNQAGDNDTIVDDAMFATVAGGQSNTATSEYSTVSGGTNNTASGSFSTVGGGFSNESSFASTIGGGSSNTASGYDSTVSGGESNTASSTDSTIGGGYGNNASGYSATIGGGTNNYTMGHHTTISGGNSNTASQFASTVGGGISNTGYGEYTTVGGGFYIIANGNYSTIAGGGPIEPTSSPSTTNNLATDDYCTIGGGGGNVAGDNAGTTTDATYATVSGGKDNTASGQYATIPGGTHNIASADYSFAAGYNANAQDEGSFVWADSQPETFSSTGYNTFSIRAQHGVFIKADSTIREGAFIQNIATTGTSAGQGTAILGQSNSYFGYGVAGYNPTNGVGVGAWSYYGNLIAAYDGQYPGGVLRFYVDQAGNLHYDGTASTFAEIPSPAGVGSSHVSLYGISAAEAWYEDLGSASLLNGKVTIVIDPLFAQTVSLSDEYQVQVTATCGEPVLLFVSEKTETSFTVQGVSLDGKTSNCGFDYRISAKPLGLEGLRLEAIEIPEPITVERDQP